MSRKIGFLNEFRDSAFGLGKGQDFLIFVSTSDSMLLHKVSLSNLLEMLKNWFPSQKFWGFRKAHLHIENLKS